MADVDPNSPPDLGKLADQIAVSLSTAADFTILKWNPLKLVTDAIVAVAVIPLAIAGELAVFAAQVLSKLLRALDPQVSDLASIILGDLFDEDLPLPSGGARSGTAISDRLGALFLNLFVSRAVTSGEGGIVPDPAPASDFLGAVMGAPIRGFLLNLIPEIIGGERGKFVHELVEDVQRGIGAGRLSRLALGPAITGAVATPLQWYVHEKVRPTLAPAGTVAKSYWRGQVDYSTALGELALHGFSDARAEQVLTDAQLFMSPAEVSLLYHRGLFDADTAIAYLKAAGWAAGDARLIIQIPGLNEITTLNNELVATYDEALRRRRISEGDYLAAVQPLFVDPALAQLHLQRALVQQKYQYEELTVAELNAALDKNILNLSEWRQALTEKGLRDDDITILELTRREIAAAHEQQAEARAAAKAASAAAAAQKAADKAAAAEARRQAAAAARAQAKADRLAAQQKAKADAEARRELVAQQAIERKAAIDKAHAARLISDQEAAQLHAEAAAHDQQAAITTSSLVAAQSALDAQQTAADRAQVEADALASSTTAAIDDANAKADAEEQAITERRAERLQALAEHLAIVDKEEAEGTITSKTATRKRDALNELDREAQVQEKLDLQAIARARAQASALAGNARRRQAAAAAKTALLPTTAARTQQRITGAAALKEQLAAALGTAHSTATITIGQKRVAAYTAASAAYQQLLAEQEQARQALEARISGG